jgi:hypothetical protein
MYKYTGSYMSGFVALGVLVILGGTALLIYGRMMSSRGSLALGTGKA